jgi:hypothetical protein
MFTARQRIVRVETGVLQDKATLQRYIEQGFCWMRVLKRSFHECLRNPIVGTRVELSFLPMGNAVRLDSPEGRALIQRQI